MNGYSRMINTIKDTKDRVVQMSKQRRGGVTDLYALDYVDTLSNDGSNMKKGQVNFRVSISGDLDRFQRWFLKVIVTPSVVESASSATPVSDAHMYVDAYNQTEGKTVTIDLTPIFRHKWACNWIGDTKDNSGIFPNSDSMDGYDLMDAAWYMNDDERKALFSPGEKIFYIKAVGEAQITLRNFIKFSHIN